MPGMAATKRCAAPSWQPFKQVLCKTVLIGYLHKACQCCKLRHGSLRQRQGRWFTEPFTGGGLATQSLHKLVHMAHSLSLKAAFYRSKVRQVCKAACNHNKCKVVYSRHPGQLQLGEPCQCCEALQQVGPGRPPSTCWASMCKYSSCHRRQGGLGSRRRLSWKTHCLLGPGPTGAPKPVDSASSSSFASSALNSSVCECLCMHTQPQAHHALGARCSHEPTIPTETGCRLRPHCGRSWQLPHKTNTCSSLTQ